jgi:hypothetical protein
MEKRRVANQLVTNHWPITLPHFANWPITAHLSQATDFNSASIHSPFCIQPAMAPTTANFKTFLNAWIYVSHSIGDKCEKEEDGVVKLSNM